MTGVCSSLLVVFLALSWPLLLQWMQEIPITVDSVHRHLVNNATYVTTVYNVVDLKAPAAAGPILHVLSYLACRSPVSPILLRYLLNANGVHLIRELAAGKFRHLAPTHHPLHRVTDDTKMAEWTALGKTHQSLLQTGIHPYSSSSSVDPSTMNTNTNTKTNAYHGIMDYHEVYRQGKATPSQVMEEVIIGATTQLEHLHMFASFRPDDIRQQAKESDIRWKAGTPRSVWDGVPVAMKDMSSVKGHALCYGSNKKSCVMADEDDIPARRLRAAGAILVGMTVMTEGGVTPLGYAVHFDGPFNPYNPDYYPGGSSGGSAVAVASGLVPMALGFDGGGSVRVPASMSGTVGLAATFARIPHHSSSGNTMIKAGPLAATLLDVALTHLLLGQSEPGSVSTELVGEAYLPPPHLEGVVDEHGMLLVNRDEEESPLKGTRLGIFWDHFQDTDPEVYEACLTAVHHLQSLGAELVNITIPHLRELHLSHGITILSEFALQWDLQFFDPDYDMEPNTEITLALGRTVKAAEVLSASRLRTFGIQKVCGELFQGMNLDAIVSPMLGDKVPKPRSGYRGYGESDNWRVYRTMRYVPLANLLGLPGLVVPVGYERDTSLPIGFQFLGDAWSEHKLIRLGMYLETWMGTRRRRPPAKNFYDPLDKFL